MEANGHNHGPHSDISPSLKRPDNISGRPEQPTAQSQQESVGRRVDIRPLFPLIPQSNINLSISRYQPGEKQKRRKAI